MLRRVELACAAVLLAAVVILVGVASVARAASATRQASNATYWPVPSAPNTATAASATRAWRCIHRTARYDHVGVLASTGS